MLMLWHMVVFHLEIRSLNFEFGVDLNGNCSLFYHAN